MSVERNVSFVQTVSVSSVHFYKDSRDDRAIPAALEIQKFKMWSAKDTLDLAEMLHGMGYKSKTTTDDALAVMAAHFGMDSEAMGKKIKNIRTQFGRALNERKEQSRSGAGTSKKKEWFAFQALQFLGKNNTSVGSRSTMEDDTEVPPSTTGTSDEASTSSATVVAAVVDETISSIVEQTTGSNVSRKRQRTDSRVDEAYSFMKSVEDTMKERDDYTAYGEVVGRRMRSAKRNSRDTAILKNKIDNLLFQFEIGGTEAMNETPSEYPLPASTSNVTPTHCPETEPYSLTNYVRFEEQR